MKYLIWIALAFMVGAMSAPVAPCETDIQCVQQHGGDF